MINEWALCSSNTLITEFWCPEIVNGSAGWSNISKLEYRFTSSLNQIKRISKSLKWTFSKLLEVKDCGSNIVKHSVGYLETIKVTIQWLRVCAKSIPIIRDLWSSLRVGRSTPFFTFSASNRRNGTNRAIAHTRLNFEPQTLSAFYLVQKFQSADFKVLKLWYVQPGSCSMLRSPMHTYACRNAVKLAFFLLRPPPWWKRKIGGTGKQQRLHLQEMSIGDKAI